MSNQLITGEQRETAQQLKLLRLAFVYSREFETGFDEETPVVIRIKDFAAQFGVADESALYQQLADGAKRLQKQTLVYTEIQPNGRKKVVSTNWVRQVIYQDGEISILFEHLIKEHIWRLCRDNPFTITSLGSYSKLSSKHSIRLYECLAKWQSAGSVVLHLNELRAFLAIPATMSVPNFTARVLKPAVIQVNEGTELKVKMKRIKDGREIKSFQFWIETKKSPTTQEALKESITYEQYCLKYKQGGESLESAMSRLRYNYESDFQRGLI